jgi:flavodoxin
VIETQGGTVKILVAYESRSGTTARVAEAIAARAKDKGAEVRVSKLADAGPEAIAWADLIAVGTWVEGFLIFGVGPARAARSWLDGLPDLGGKKAAAFCTFALNPRGTLATVSAALRGKNAQVVATAAFNRRRPTQGLEAFADSLVGSA